MILSKSKGAFGFAGVTEGFQVDVIGESKHFLGGDPAFRNFAVFVHVFDEQAFAAVDGFAQFGGQVHAFLRPGGRVIDPDVIIQRFAVGFERLHHGKEKVLRGQRIRLGA